MDRRVPVSDREIHGATLEVSTMGGYSVHRQGAYVGYIHATTNHRWNTYRRVPNAPDEHLGVFAQEEAVSAILLACDRASRTEAA